MTGKTGSYMSAAVLYLSTWDTAIPVLLPYGARTIQGVLPASLGMALPVGIFMLIMFQFMYTHHWYPAYLHMRHKLVGASGSIGTAGAYRGATTGGFQPGGGTMAMNPRGLMRVDPSGGRYK